MQRTPKRHGFQPLLFAPPQGYDALPKTLPPLAFLEKSRKNASGLVGDGTPANTFEPPVRADDNAARHDSCVRLRLVEAPPSTNQEEEAPPTLRGSIEWLEAQDLLDELAEDQLMLSMNLTCLERIAQSRPRDVSTLAALRCLDDRIADLMNMRDALAVMHLSTIAKSVHRAFLPDAPLADYVRGVYAWLHAVVRALDTLSHGLQVMQADWASYRWRIEEAKNFHFDELEEAIRADLESLVVESGDEEAVGQLAASFEGLLDEARVLEAKLDERFG